MFQPQRFGRYLLIRKLATGGMAEIFLGKLLGAAGFEKELVVKKILPQWSSDRDFISMLIDEAKIAVQLSHPNIVQVYELAREGEAYYIAMEYVNGVDLRRLMQKAASLRKKIPLEVSLMIMAEVLEGLAYAHSRKDGQGRGLQIIHRDISPQNILVSYDGHAKITDFGIAKAASRSQETAVGVLKGKFAYMSPEQANQEPLDLRSDLFSTAVVLYELLSGERLFYRGSDIDTLDRVRRGQVTFSEKAEKLIPTRLKEMLLKALSKERENRYPEAASFCDDLLKVARRSKKALKHEKVASFLHSLFAEEIQAKREEETRLITQATPLLLEETRTAGEKEIFAQRGEPGATGEAETKRDRFPLRQIVEKLEGLKIRREIFLGGLLIVVTAAIVLFFMIQKPQKIESASEQPSPPSQERPVPPEVAPPIRETQTIPATPVLPSVTEAAPPKTQQPTPTQLPKTATDEPKLASVKKETQEKGFLSVQAIPWGYVSVDGGGRWETPLRKLALKAGRHRVAVSYEPEGAVLSSQITVSAAEEVVCVASFRGKKGIRCQ